MEDLNDQLLKHKDALKLSKNKESSLLDDMDDLNQELQKKMKAYTKVLREKDDIEKENEELKKQNKRLTNSIQVSNPFCHRIFFVLYFFSTTIDHPVMKQVTLQSCRNLLRAHLLSHLGLF